MIASVVLRALNLKAMLSHLRSARLKRHDVGVEAELQLYAGMLQSDFLHAGYFRNIPQEPEAISLKDLKEAMLLRQMRDAGLSPTGLTPSRPHAEYIRRRNPDIPVIVGSFEQLDLTPHRQAFDVVVSTESFHNVPLDPGLRNIREVLKPGGRWIIVDYYRLRENAYNRSGHLLAVFRQALERNGFRVVEEVDITVHTLPTLAFAHCLAARIGLPLLEFGMARYFRRHPLIEYLLRDVVRRARSRVRLDALDPAVAARDKCYLLQQICP
ncbi:MAG: class I SAM-dependent methyltransferase [Betaproteobacteria bacterium]|nr:class I SAM-dependent methyltransferase [Betaproteobacteria bacterium]